MPHRIVRLGRTRVILVEPENGSLGYIVSDVLVSLHAARAFAATVCILRPKNALNTGIFELSSLAVRVVRSSSVWGRLARMMWNLGEYRELVRMHVSALRRALQTHDEPPGGKRDGSSWTRRKLVYREHIGAAERQRVRSDRVPPDIGIDHRESQARQPVAVMLPPQLVRRLEPQAAAVGLEPGTPFIAIHAREPGYKGRGGDRPTDTMRNARIETYFEAIDRLTELGYRVVRIGDPSMRPLEREGVVDLATSPRRTDLLELWCVLNAKLLIACDSGPYLMSWLTQVPCLAVNMTNPLSGYPLLPSHQYILKHVMHVASGKMLSLRELIGPEYLLSRKDLELYRYLDNTPAEIATAVDDMLTFLRNRQPPTPAQDEYRRLIEQALADPVIAALATKRSDRPFYIGDGRIAASFAERYLDAGTSAHPALAPSE